MHVITSISKILITSLLILGGLNFNYAQRVSVEKAEPMTDIRDGQVYQTAHYSRTFPNGQGYSFIWMTENLNFIMEGSYCYNDSLANCDIYGRLYTWDAANQACPAGWHLPNDEEWYMLAFLFGGNCQSGTALKSESTLWSGERSGSNEALFDALPSGSGSISGPYYASGRLAIFWSADARDGQSAWDWKLKNDAELQRWYGKKVLKNAVRCVKD